MPEEIISEEQSAINTPLTRILYAEDEPDIQIVVQIPLQAAGFTLEICNSGQEALQKAATFKADLILLDVMMPGMDGPATLKELRRNPETLHTPVIFMTAKTQKKEIDEYKKLGSLEVITKPFDPMTLTITLKRIWEDSFKTKPEETHSS